MFQSSSNSIPTITNHAELLGHLRKWRTSLRRLLKRPLPPPPPLNFQATQGRGGITLSWAPVHPTSSPTRIASAQQADGYEIVVSKTGDFASDAVVIPIRSRLQTTYTHAVPGPPGKFFFRMRTTSGTSHDQASLAGPDTGTVIHTSLDPSDTVTVPTSVRDQFTTDATRATARFGRYQQR